MIGGKINTDGSLAWASDPRVSSGRTPGTTVGDYTIYFPPNFRVMSLTVNNAAGNARFSGIILGYSGVGSARIVQYSTAGAATDEAVVFTAVGV